MWYIIITVAVCFLNSFCVMANLSESHFYHAGEMIHCHNGVSMTLSDIMTQQLASDQCGTSSADRFDIDQALFTQYGTNSIIPYHHIPKKNPQVLGTNFTGVTLPEVGLFPPDAMGAIGPDQFIIAINGRIRSFDKSTGLSDGVMNVDTDLFFSPVAGGNFTTDPRIRYDRLSGRWFILMINVPSNCDNNRVMIAVSDSSTITHSTIWKFFYFTVGAGNFLDYPTLGIDINALYIGGKTFSNNNTGQVFVVRKSSILDSGPLVVTTFNNIINAQTGTGLFVPQGVDNFDGDATVGYFIGVDNVTFGTLVLRRVIDPAGTPTLSDDIVLSVESTRLPVFVPHLGNDNGTVGYLDPVDDRLLIAHIRNGHLWTAHHIGVDNKGVSSSKTRQTRNGCRWYEIDVSSLTPSVVQSGTLYMPSVQNTTDKRSYWVPSLMTSGQGHMALGCSVAGDKEYINAVVAGRLATDPLGTLRQVTQYTVSSTAYNPSEDIGNNNKARQWGNYSYTSIDPCDDMTMWTIQEYCNETNSWGVCVAQLLAPLPATPYSISPSFIKQGQSSVDFVITGRAQQNGAAFFDPGDQFACRPQVVISGGVVVNSVTYINQTKLKINISSIGASVGPQDVTVINPDGQSITTMGLFSVIS